MSDRKGFFASLFSGFSKEDKQEAIAALSEDGKAPASTVQLPAAQPPAQHQATAPASDQESAQVRQLRAQIETERNARIQSQAEAFADFITGPSQRRALPAERSTIISLFTQAMRDDLNSPAKVAFVVTEAGADGKPVQKATEGTRVEALKATYAARPAHALTEELVAFDESTMRALSNRDGSQAEIEKAKASAVAYAEKQNRGGQSKRVN